MDSQNSSLNANSQRRRLTKKPPHHHARSSSGLDGGFGFDARSLHSKRSTPSLRRSPSAPHARPNYPSASTSSSPRHPPSIQRSNPSPLLGAAEFSFPSSSSTTNHQPSPTAAASAPLPQQRAGRLSDPQSGIQFQHQHQHQHQPQYQNPPPLTHHTGGDDFIGAPFDGAAILNHLDAPHLTPPAPKPNHPPPLVKANTDTFVMTSSAPQPNAFTTMDHPMPSEKPTDTRVVEHPVSGPKRFSDEANEPKIGEPKIGSILRKKSGFSGFVSGLVGSPKKPVISAPENPVHVTHVGYDSNTGQFTVRITAAKPPSRGDRCSGHHPGSFVLSSMPRASILPSFIPSMIQL